MHLLFSPPPIFVSLLLGDKHFFFNNLEHCLFRYTFIFIFTITVSTLPRLPHYIPMKTFHTRKPWKTALTPEILCTYNLVQRGLLG